MDLSDDGKEIHVTAELPGVPKENLDLEVKEDGLDVGARVEEERTEESTNYFLQERVFNTWYRRVPFPAEVNPDKAEAELRDGILHFKVPRKEPLPEKTVKKVRVK